MIINVAPEIRGKRRLASVAVRCACAQRDIHKPGDTHFGLISINIEYGLAVITDKTK